MFLVRLGIVFGVWWCFGLLLWFRFGFYGFFVWFGLVCFSFLVWLAIILLITSQAKTDEMALLCGFAVYGSHYCFYANHWYNKDYTNKTISRAGLKMKARQG
ncbi:MAG: hypothetical protein HQ536_02175 [Parcubacteria group bacterium]|nr:hypothetical protein [Parcubacteria group bacterium]